MHRSLWGQIKHLAAGAVTSLVVASEPSVTSQRASSALRFWNSGWAKGVEGGLSRRGERRIMMRAQWGVFHPYLGRMILWQGHEENPSDNSINSIKGKRSSRITLRWNEGCRGLEAFLRVPLDLWPSDKEGIKSQQGWIYTECKQETHTRFNGQATQWGLEFNER